MSRQRRRSTPLDMRLAGALLTLLICGATIPVGACERTPDMPAHVPRLIDEGLSRAQYGELSEQWRTYADAHPESGIALVELERALRYAQRIKSPQQLEMIRKAVEAEPACGIALDRLANLEFENTIWGDRSQLPKARALAERAIEATPGAWEPHQTLWAMDVVTGNAADAGTHMAACLDKGGFASPLLDYAFNMLSTAVPNAIVFTNGDHDTFPLLALQARYDVRADVRIVNLSMATFPSYAKWTLNGSGAASPLSDTDIDRLHKDLKPGTFFGRVLLQEVAQRVADGRWQQPVYAATTIPWITDMITNRLEIQGLLYRIDSKTVDNPEDALQIDVARTDSLFEYVYRMESSMDLGFHWSSKPAVAQIMINYVGCYRRMLVEYAAAGDLEAARRMLRNILPLLEFHEVLRHWDGHDRAEMLLTYWQELDPRNPEVDRWRRRLEL